MKKTIISVIHKTFFAAFLSALVIASSGVLLSSCSSGPKREMEVYTIYSAASSLLESANSCILCGDYEKAELLLNSAYKQAMSVDNYDLLTSITLAQTSLNLSYNPPKIAQARDFTEQAAVFASYSADVEKQLALVELNKVRISLADTESAADYKKLHSSIQENQNKMAKDPYNQAQFISVDGDIYRQEKDYKNAEQCYVQAAKLYTDNRYLSEIGITWYKTALVRSQNGVKNGALEAMENAIYYDRCAENSLALAVDYKAVGTILMKGNPTEKEKAKADYAFKHSEEIYEAAKK